MGDGSDACCAHGGGLLFEVGNGACAGLWAIGDWVPGPGAYVSLTPGPTACELTAGQNPAASLPSRVYHNVCYRHVAKVRGAGGLSYEKRHLHATQRPARIRELRSASLARSPGTETGTDKGRNR